MPSSPTFQTVPHELQQIAHACWTELRGQGYALRCEHAENHFPETATIYFKQGTEQHFFIFDGRVKHDRVSLWASFGRSCSSGTYVVLCVPDSVDIQAKVAADLRNFGIGLTVVSAAGMLTNVVQPIDLSLNIALPPLNRHATVLRPQLAKIHSQFAKGDWQHGFEEACKLVEKSARNYLLRQIRSGGTAAPVRVAVGPNAKVRTLNLTAVTKMPLGALADAFCNLLAPKPIDALLCAGLKSINVDRINVAHDKLNSRTVKRLRANVGRHMWTIDNLLRGIPG